METEEPSEKQEGGSAEQEPSATSIPDTPEIKE